MQILWAVAPLLAFGAGEREVGAQQGEAGVLVVEVGAIAIHAVMAGQAILAEVQQVVEGENLIELAVAGAAGLGPEIAQVILVAVAAGKGRTVGALGVAAQGIAESFVFGGWRSAVGERCLRPAMLGMASAAAPRILQCGVQAVGALQLHPGALVGGRVTSRCLLHRVVQPEAEPSRARSCSTIESSSLRKRGLGLSRACPVGNWLGCQRPLAGVGS